METVIFTCKYFKFISNTTGLSQSHFRNVLTGSIKRQINARAGCRMSEKFKYCRRRRQQVHLFVVKLRTRIKSLALLIFKLNALL